MLNLFFLKVNVNIGMYSCDFSGTIFFDFIKMCVAEIFWEIINENT